jgi:hypothetical protein
MFRRYARKVIGMKARVSQVSFLVALGIAVNLSSLGHANASRSVLPVPWSEGRILRHAPPDGKSSSGLFASTVSTITNQWYVSPTGNDASDCHTPATACASISGALAKALPGDTINVAAGVYHGTQTISADVTIRGAGAGATILDGGLQGSVVTIQAGTVSISGVTIQDGGWRGSGGGVLNWGVLTLADSVVQSNHVTFGTGGGIGNGNVLTMTNLTVSGNNALDGGGVENAGTLTMDHSTVSGNRSLGLYAAGIDNNGTLTVTNSVIANNVSAGVSNDGGGITNDLSASALYLAQSTVSGNTGIGIGGWGL